MYFRDQPGASEGVDPAGRDAQLQRRLSIRLGSVHQGCEGSGIRWPDPSRPSASRGAEDLSRRFRRVGWIRSCWSRRRRRLSVEGKSRGSRAGSSIICRFPASPASATALPADLEANIRQLKSVSERPMCVGFGINKPEHVAQLAGVADGAIVGSAFVRRMTEHASRGPRRSAKACRTIAGNCSRKSDNTLAQPFRDLACEGG